MTDDLLDDQFRIDTPAHPLERIGFRMIKNDSSRVWAGSSNVYIETKSFRKRDNRSNEWTLELETRRGETGPVIFHRITGEVRLSATLTNEKRSIKSKRPFWPFGKRKQQIDVYYQIQPKITSTELTDLLFVLSASVLDIQIEKTSITFHFYFERFDNGLYEPVVDLLDHLSGQHSKEQ